MSREISVRCTGPEQHVNHIPLDHLLQDVPVVRRYNAPPPDLSNIPARFVKRCTKCTHDVIITRDMIRQVL